MQENNNESTSQKVEKRGVKKWWKVMFWLLVMFNILGILALITRVGANIR